MKKLILLAIGIAALGGCDNQPQAQPADPTKSVGIAHTPDGKTMPPNVPGTIPGSASSGNK